MPPSLLDRLVEEIGRDGPLRFDRYMEVVLYDPSAGFYAGGGGSAGRQEGDFLTSPEVGPLFGAVICRALDAWWDELSQPDRFPVVEGGAGRGALAASVLRAEPRCAAALVWVAVERSERLAGAQRELLRPWSRQVRRVRSLAAVPEALGHPGGAPAAVQGIVIGNELLDNLPVRLARRAEARWEELCVSATGDGLGWAGAALDEPTGARLDALVPDAEFGDVVPVADEARRWVGEACALLAEGRVVLFDYGAESAALARRPAWEWLRTYRDHGDAGDPLVEPGTKDVTCEVPIDQLDHPPPDEVTTQRAFLRRHGIEDLVAEGRRIWTERAHLGDLEALAARSRVREADALCDRDGMGSFAALTFPAAGARP